MFSQTVHFIGLCTTVDQALLVERDAGIRIYVFKKALKGLNVSVPLIKSEIRFLMFIFNVWTVEISS